MSEKYRDACNEYKQKLNLANRESLGGKLPFNNRDDEALREGTKKLNNLARELGLSSSVARRIEEQAEIW